MDGDYIKLFPVFHLWVGNEYISNEAYTDCYVIHNPVHNIFLPIADGVGDFLKNNSPFQHDTQRSSGIH